MTKARGLRGWLRRLLPWTIALGALGLIASRYSFEGIALEMAQGNFWAMVPVTLALPCTAIFFITIADRAVFRSAFGSSPPFLTLVRAKAAIGLVELITYAAGKGGYGVWLSKRTGANSFLIGSTMFYLAGADLIGVCGVAALSLLFWPIEELGGLRPYIAGVASLMLLFKMLGPLRVVRLPRFLSAWHQIDRGASLLNVAVRSANLVYISLGAWLAATAFGLEIPLTAVVAALPLILLVGSLPVNVGGFGAVQGAWLFFFEPYASGEQILAFNLLWTLQIKCAIALRGLPFLKKTTDEIAAARATADEDSAEGEAAAA